MPVLDMWSEDSANFPGFGNQIFESAFIKRVQSIKVTTINQ